MVRWPHRHLEMPVIAITVKTSTYQIQHVPLIKIETRPRSQKQTPPTPSLTHRTEESCRFQNCASHKSRSTSGRR